MHFMKNMAIVGGSLAFVASGAGAYSLDARIVTFARHRTA
jgi:putative oxidoreductase